jgi:hypothetical protein
MCDFLSGRFFWHNRQIIFPFVSGMSNARHHLAAVNCECRNNHMEAAQVHGVVGQFRQKGVLSSICNLLAASITNDSISSNRDAIKSASGAISSTSLGLSEAVTRDTEVSLLIPSRRSALL